LEFRVLVTTAVRVRVQGQVRDLGLGLRTGAGVWGGGENALRAINTRRHAVIGKAQRVVGCKVADDHVAGAASALQSYYFTSQRKLSCVCSISGKAGSWLDRYGTDKLACTIRGSAYGDQFGVVVDSPRIRVLVGSLDRKST